MMCTSGYLGLGFSFLRNSLCLMVVIWMLAEYDLTVVHLSKCIFSLRPALSQSGTAYEQCLVLEFGY